MRASRVSLVDSIGVGVALLAVLFAGCSDRESWRDSGSLPGVTSWSLEEEWRLGGYSETHLNLSRIVETIPAPDGGLSFSQLNLARIITLNADGSVRHVAGGPGSGPGEWSGYPPPRIAWHRDELKVVAGNRVHTFDAAGEHVQTALVQRVSDVARSRVLMQLRGGGFVGLGGSLQRTGRGIRPDVVVHWDPDGSSTDSITTTHGDEYAVRVSIPPRLLVTRRPFPGGDRYYIAPDGSGLVAVDVGNLEGAEGDSAAFQVRIYGEDGEPTSDFRVDYVTRRVSASEWSDSIAGRRESLEGRWGIPAAEIERALREAFGPPPVIHPVAAVVISTNGDLWIERGDLGEPGVRMWEVRNPEGKRTGVLRLASDTRLGAVDGRVAWTVVTDELDVPVLVRNHLVAGTSER